MNEHLVKDSVRQRALAMFKKISPVLYFAMIGLAPFELIIITEIRKRSWGSITPLVLIILFAISPRLLLVWIAFVLAKPSLLWVHQQFPEGWKNRIELSLSSLANSALVRDLSEGADQVLPFILFWFYLCCAPFAVAWMGVHWVRQFIRPKVLHSNASIIVLLQNKRADFFHCENENNFYHSRAFGLIVFVFFASGIPAYFSYSIYQHLQVDQALQTTASAVTPSDKPESAMPAAVAPPVGIAMERNQPDLASVVTGYKSYWPQIRDFRAEPTKSSVFVVHFYLVSLASAMSVLFFRAWFTFPLNFLSDEHDIEFTARGIRRKSMKSWFTNVVTMNR